MAQIRISGTEGICNYDNCQQQSFSYLHVQAPTEIETNHSMVVGKPISLHQIETNKKLVLTLFLDSFNAKISFM